MLALVPAAGQGTRLGLNQPKAFVQLAGRTLLEWAVDGLYSSGVVDEVIVMVPPSMLNQSARVVPKAHVVVGGLQRTDSVRAGLAAAHPDHGLVLVHDAARPLTPPALISRVVGALDAGADAVIPVVPVADTIKQVGQGESVQRTVDRADLRAVQTPQGFRFDVLQQAYAAAQNEIATDDAGLVERNGGQIRTVAGDPLAFKITTSFDLRVATALVREEQ